MKNKLLEMKNIHKKFPGVYALKGVDFELNEGEVHAIVGENGAGKSTLINILGGIHQKDEGSIYVNNQEVNVKNVLDARNLGINIIHQELVLVPHLSVAENIYINREPVKSGFIDYKALYSEAQNFIDEIGLDLPVNIKVAQLTLAQQQMLEIVKAISFNAKVIVMDEPTSSLSDKEISALFERIKALKEKNYGIIYISHKMSELFQIADRVTILRDGKDVITLPIAETTNDIIVKHMVGREIKSYYTRTYNKKENIVLKVKGLTTKYINDVSFNLYKGEILGFSGLVGAGRTEIIRGLLGFDKVLNGTVKIEGNTINICNPEQAYDYGIGYIPENRREEGIIPLQTIKFNASIKILNKFMKGIRLYKGREDDIVKKFIKLLKVKTPSLTARIQNLSGGNQQKVVIARWLATEPKILIMDEPTRGIDVGSKAEIYEIMNDLASRGIAIIMISSELPEIINMSDRVCVIRQGRIVKELAKEELDQTEIMKYAITI